MMKDALLVLEHLFNWKFLSILLSFTAVGLFLPDRYLKLFRSVRFNIYLFLVIAVISAAGTFLPQEKASAVIYHSWWFAAILALMAFDVVTCKLRRLPAIIFGPPSAKRKTPDTIEHFFSKSKLRAELNTSQSSTDTVDQVRSWLKSQGMKYEESEKSIGVTFFAGRQRLQRWGDFILHVSIVAVLAGNLMGVMFGFEEVLPIQEGQTVTMKNRPYTVALNDFTIEYYKDSGAPSVFASDLTVKQGERELAHKRIVVNDPLDINRVRFYQATWGMTYDFHSAQMLVLGKNLELKPHEIVPVPGTPLSIRANTFLPSFDIDADGRPITKDYEGKNPAVQIDFLEKGVVQARVWLLKNSPHTAFKFENERVTPAAPPPFHLMDVDPVLFSGIQVGYDPGAPLFWTGSIVLLIGLCMHFYMHQRRLRILVHKKGSGADVIVGGWNSRTPEEFQQEFSDWVGGLRQSIS